MPMRPLFSRAMAPRPLTRACASLLLLALALPVIVEAQRPAHPPAAPRVRPIRPMELDDALDLRMKLDLDQRLRTELADVTVTIDREGITRAVEEARTSVLANVDAMRQDAMRAWTVGADHLALSTRIDRPGDGSRAATPPPAWAPADPADSLYRQARDLLNRGDYRRAAQLFRDIAQRFPKSDYTPDALYWDAFARYRIGSTDELRRALESLDQQRQRYPQAKTQADAATLATRIRGALAARGDAQAAASLEREARNASAGGPDCDQEDQSVRSEALAALAQADLASAMPIVRKVLARRDECSATLRRRALFIIGQRADTSSVDLLSEVARSDPSLPLRSEAVLWLARIPGDRALSAIDALLRSSGDERVQRAAVRALAAHPDPRGRQMVRALAERADASETLRSEALGTFERDNATGEDAAFVRALYPRLKSDRLRERAVAALVRMGGSDNQQWLLALARNADEPVELRGYALRWTARSNVPIGDAVKLYDAVAERYLREQLIEVYGYRKEPEATDKLIEIVKTGTDPSLRRRAINALSRKNDPRTTRLLMEIIGS